MRCINCGYLPAEAKLEINDYASMSKDMWKRYDNDPVIRGIIDKYKYNELPYFKALEDVVSFVINEPKSVISRDIEHDLLVDAIKSIDPIFSVMEGLDELGYGKYIGGHREKWLWNEVLLSKTSTESLLKLYNGLKAGTHFEIMSRT
jgi:hypothetical protein